MNVLPRREWGGDVLPQKQRAKGRRVALPLDSGHRAERAQLGAPYDRTVVCSGPVEWFLAHPVTKEPERPCVPIHNRQGKLPHQSVERGVNPHACDQLSDRLSVSFALKSHPFRLQLLPNPLVIVDFPIEAHQKPAGRVGGRLRTAFHIDDGQPANTQCCDGSLWT